MFFIYTTAGERLEIADALVSFHVHQMPQQPNRSYNQPETLRQQRNRPRGGFSVSAISPP